MPYNHAASRLASQLLLCNRAATTMISLVTPRNTPHLFRVKADGTLRELTPTTRTKPGCGFHMLAVLSLQAAVQKCP